MLGSQEVHDIAVALGVDPGSEKSDGLRYGKICILADADSDGAHIATLLCALFLRHFRGLVEDGRIHVAMPPLYRIDVGKEVFYALDEREKKGILDRLEAEGKKGQAQRAALQGAGRDEPPPAPRDHHGPRDPPPRPAHPARDEEGANDAATVIDRLLAKDRSGDRKEWLMEEGNRAEVEV